MRKAVLIAAFLTLAPALASAGPITFDLRALAIEAIDEVNSFSLTLDGLTATLSAVPTTYDGNPLVLNRTSAGFGINVVNLDAACGGEDSTRVDGGCTDEAIKFVFDAPILVNSLFVSSFGFSSTLGQDRGLATIGSTDFDILTTGNHLLGDTFLAAGSEMFVAYTAGNGFSLDNITVTVASVPEPATLTLLLLGSAAASLRRRTV